MNATRIPNAKKRAKENPAVLYLDGLAPSGRRAMRSLLRQAIKVLGNDSGIERFDWTALTYARISRIRASLLELNKSASTINATLAALSGVSRTAYLSGLVSGEDYQRIQSVPRVKGKPLPAGRSLSRSEFSALLKACRSRSAGISGIRDAAIFAVMGGAGLRRSEVVGLWLDDYDAKSGMLRIRHGKGNKARQLSVPSKTRELLRDWLKARGKTPGALFCAIPKSGQPNFQPLSTQAVYAFVKRRCEQAKIEPCSPHDLRRTFITYLLDDGVDINTTRQLAGHEQIQTTVRYDRRDEKSQRRAMANFTL
jgi:integrase/recombinase XerD